VFAFLAVPQRPMVSAAIPRGPQLRLLLGVKPAFPAPAQIATQEELGGLSLTGTIVQAGREVCAFIRQSPPPPSPIRGPPAPLAAWGM
jgi:hypothetical protein